MTTLSLVPCLLLAAGLALAVMFPRGGRWLVLAASAAALAVFAARFAEVPEDVFISMRYARHLAEGHGLVYNVGERVEGYTNFLWTLVLAAIHVVRLPPLETAVALSIASGIGVLVLATLAFPRLTGTPGAAPFCIAALVLLPPFWDAAGGGLETAFYAFWVTGAALAHALAVREKRPPGVAAAVFLVGCVLTRPEGVYVAGLLAASSVVATRFDRGFLRGQIKVALAVGAVVVAHEAWRVAYYGEWLPNTFYCKVGASFAQVRRGVDQWLHFLRTGCALLLVPCLAAPWLVKRRPELLPPLALAAGYTAYVIAIGGDNFWRHRYLAPIVPCALLVSELVVREVFAASFAALPRTALALLAAAFPVAVWGQVDGHKLPPPRQGVDSQRFAEMRAYGEWLTKNTPEGGSVAVTAAGVVPYYTRRDVIDMFGLNDHHIARVKPRDTVGSRNAGHEKYDFRYVLSREPEFVVNFMPVDHDNHNALQTIACEADPALEADFLKKYDLYDVVIADVQRVGLRRKR